MKRIDANGLHSLTTREGLSNNVVWSLIEDHAGSLWVGTRLGLNRVTDGLSSRYTTAEGLPNDTVWALYEDGEGTLCVGNDGGLARFRNGRVASFGVRDGLFDYCILQIVEDDDGRLWMGSPHGIFRVRKRELEEVAQGMRLAVTSVSYGVGDGLRSLDCNKGTQPAAWKSRDGRLWFTTAKGLAVVDPRVVVDEAKAPSALMEEALVDGKPLGPESAETGRRKAVSSSSTTRPSTCAPRRGCASVTGWMAFDHGLGRRRRAGGSPTTPTCRRAAASSA